MRTTLSCLALLVLLMPLALGAQAPADSVRPPVEFNDRGITFNARDGVTSFTLRFRVQQWAVFSTQDDDDLRIESTQIAVRRARLRFESVVWDPRLKVNVQLSFSRGDQDFENSNFPNVLRDAYVTWQATPRLALVAGQGKLPGNRQRVISSSELQFPDRSIVNAAFTIDRDVGFFAHYEAKGGMPFNIRAAVTGGEGRNAPVGDEGLAYTGRLEILPFGSFSNGGDYFESDLSREPNGRLSIGATVSRNNKAVRTGGQLGRPLFAPRGMTTTLVDMMYKYQGLSLSAEYARRDAQNPVTTDGTDTRYVLAGSGFTAQVGWLTTGMLEPALRYSVVAPDNALAGVPGAEEQRQLSVALTRYLKRHRVKVQGEVIRDEFRNALTGGLRDNWTLRTSLEVGI